MKKQFILLLVLFNLFIGSAFADSELIKMFNASFSSGYQAGRCGDNITAFVTRADQKRINLNTANILIISNKGYNTFGLVNVEVARGALRNGPGATNWHHHVILEKDGLIYDYDYTNEAKVVSVKNYFSHMFLSDKRGEGLSSDYVNPEEKLDDYEVEVISAYEMLDARRDRRKTPEGEKLRLRKYLMAF